MIHDEILSEILWNQNGLRFRNKFCCNSATLVESCRVLPASQVKIPWSPEWHDELVEILQSKSLDIHHEGGRSHKGT